MFRKLSEYDWPANPSCENASAVEQKLIDRRADIECIGTVEDVNNFYSYNDYAIVRLDGEYYLLHTSGCSCPSPSETWGVQHGPCSLQALREHLKTIGEPKDGYDVPQRQYQEFVDLCDAAEG